MIDIESKIKEYASKNKQKCFALADWKKLNVKDFSMMDILKCIYNEANGSTQKMTDIIEHLTSKKKVFGRSQVYLDDKSKKVDIIRNENGELELVGYNPDDKLPLKGQHQHSPKKFRKADDRVSKVFQKADERLHNLGELVRDIYPDEDNHFITFAMQAIRKFAVAKKLNAEKIAKGLKSGKYTLDPETWVISGSVKGENKKRSKTIIIDESDIKRIQDDVEMTEYKFHSGIRNFIARLLQDPVNTQPPFIFKANGYNRSLLLRYLIDHGILTRDERISDRDENGEPKTATMMVKFKCPKKNFDRKLEKLYIRLFEKNLPKSSYGIELNEDGEGGEAISDGSSTDPTGATSTLNNQSYVANAFLKQPIRRKMSSEIEESTDTFSTGDYQFIVPLGKGKGKNNKFWGPAMRRKNGKGRSVSINHK